MINSITKSFKILYILENFDRKKPVNINFVICLSRIEKRLEPLHSILTPVVRYNKQYFIKH